MQDPRARAHSWKLCQDECAGAAFVFCLENFSPHSSVFLLWLIRGDARGAVRVPATLRTPEAACSSTSSPAPPSPPRLCSSLAGDQSGFIIGAAMAAPLQASFKLQARLLSVNSALLQTRCCHRLAASFLPLLKRPRGRDSPGSPAAEPLASGLGTERCCGHRGRAHCSSA